jgi:N-acetylmuramoyl-L-alanine amidase
MNKFLLIILLIKSSFALDLALDVGHTEKRFGATSASCKKEYEYNSELTKYIYNSIKSNSNIKIETNLSNKNTTFKERYELSKNKDLFVSIHHDSVQNQYIKYLNKCPNTNHASGYSIFISKKNINFEKSLELARLFSKNLLTQGLKPSLYHNENIKGENRELIDKELGIYLFDDLLVLKNAKSPAFLFEAGFIVNPSDEKLVKTDAFKNKVVNAFLELIKKKNNSNSSL